MLKPADRPGGGGGVVGVAADAAQRRGGRALDVDLAVDVDLDGRVDREQRVRRQPAQVVGELERVQQRAAVRPRVQARPARQVRRDRISRRAGRAQSRSTTASGSSPESILTGTASSRSKAVATGLGPTCTRAPGATSGAISAAIAWYAAEGSTSGSTRRRGRGRPHDHDLVGGQRRPRVGARRGRRHHRGDQRPASIAARCQDTSLPNSKPPFALTTVATSRSGRHGPCSERGHGRHPGRGEAHLARVNRAAQPPARHERPDVGERGDVEPGIGLRHPAEDQPDAAAPAQRPCSARRRRTAARRTRPRARPSSPAGRASSARPGPRPKPRPKPKRSPRKTGVSTVTPRPRSRSRSGSPSPRRRRASDRPRPRWSPGSPPEPRRPRSARR